MVTPKKEEAESKVPLWIFRYSVVIIGFFMTFYFYEINNKLASIDANVSILMNERGENHQKMLQVTNQSELNRMDLLALYRWRYEHETSHK